MGAYWDWFLRHAGGVRATTAEARWAGSGCHRLASIAGETISIFACLGLDKSAQPQISSLLGSPAEDQKADLLSRPVLLKTSSPFRFRP